MAEAAADLKTPGGTSKFAANQGLDKLRPPESGAVDYFTDYFRFEPRSTEAVVLTRIEDMVESEVGAWFAQADAVLEALYETVRDFEIGPGGEKVYLTYEDGRYREDWSRLTRDTAEEAIWGLQRVILGMGKKSTAMEMRMKFAFTVWDEAYHEHYRGPVEGTIQDRSSHARRQTRDSRYYYLYTYMMSRTVQDRVQALQDTRRMIEFQLQRGTTKKPDAFRY